MKHFNLLEVLMCFLSEISSNGAHLFRPWSFHKISLYKWKIVRLKKTKKKKIQQTSSTSPIEFLTFSTGSTITVTCVTKQPSRCEWQQSQQFLWPDTRDSKLKFMWFHTCDPQVYSLSLRVHGTQCVLLGLNLLYEVKFPLEMFGCFWFGTACLSPTLSCLMGHRGWKVAALSLALLQEQRKMYWPATEQPQGKSPPLRKRKALWKR